MKKIKTTIIFVIILVLLCFIGCKKSDPTAQTTNITIYNNIIVSETGLGNIHGIVSDFATGKPVTNAKVELQNSGLAVTTYNDGKYEFQRVPNGNYKISVTRSEYSPYNDNSSITIKEDTIRHDIHIEKIPTYIRLTDLHGNDISCLDFGSNLSTNLKAFNIFNNGTLEVGCEIKYVCEWIRSVSAILHTIQPGQTVTVSIEIDRSKLETGENTTELFVITNNGSNTLEIKATGI